MENREIEYKKNFGVHFHAYIAPQGYGQDPVGTRNRKNKRQNRGHFVNPQIVC